MMTEADPWLWRTSLRRGNPDVPSPALLAISDRIIGWEVFIAMMCFAGGPRDLAADALERVRCA